jgi:hypothetical protein
MDIKKNCVGSVRMFVSTSLGDGLGNQLFYMAAVYGYGRKHGRVPAIMISIGGMNPHSCERFENTVFEAFEKINEPIAAAYRECGDECLVYREIPCVGEECRNLFLRGFFQHEDYLSGYKQDFLRILRFPHTAAEILQWGPLDNTCFLHVRCGDYLKATKHNVNLVKYYERAIEYVSVRCENVRFLVFSDDIDLCRTMNVLKDRANVVFCTEEHDVTSMVLMSKCGVGGICANSTFSWWGAFLGFDDGSKIVTFPNKWFNGLSWQNDIAFRGSIILPTEDE